MSDAPAEAAPIYAGTNFMLLDSDWPTFSGLVQFDAGTTTKLIKYTGCRCTQMTATFEPGQRVPLDFTFLSISPEYDNDTTVDFAGSLDTTTRFLTCLGVDVSATFAGVAKGTPTVTETILSAPSFGVAIGDEILLETATEWETATITVVSGNAGEDITLTHTAVTAAVDAADVVYVRRKKCAAIGDSLTITVEMETELINCMAETYGKSGIEFNGRMVTIEKNPWFQDWQEFLLRDNAVGSELTVYMGTETGKIMTWYLPNIQNTEVSINNDAIRRNEVTAIANKDTRIGNKNEIIIANF